MTSPSAALLLLSDGRTPTGGHAHSGGLEAAVRSGAVADARGLHSWLTGRLHTTGRVDAGFACRAWWTASQGGDRAAELAGLAGEYWARTPSPAIRKASRAQSRGVLRVGRVAWPSSELEAMAAAIAGEPPWPIVYAVVGFGAGVTRAEVAVSVALASIQGPAWAATRLIGIDPYSVASSLANLAADVEIVAALAEEGSRSGDLPGQSAPLLEIGAESHASWEVRLFAS